MKISIDKSHKELTRRIIDRKGTYTIPYIQSGSELSIKADEYDSPLVKLLNDKFEFTGTAYGDTVYFDKIPPGEYILKINDHKYFPLAIGTIIAAIGDSISEGYHGHAFYRDDLNLNSDVFPAEAVSKDGRNFPQYSPTAHIHKPEFNCMQSWMSELNDLLTEYFQQAFFIANEGWGGYDSGQYLKMVQEDQNWRSRISGLAPNCWLVHLGINDERHGLSAEQFYENMSGLINTLKNDFNAVPETIYLATPSYDYDGNMELLDAYIPKVEKLIEEHGINKGADFYKAYSIDREKCYGDDPVHPNIAGMKYMARLWSETIIKHKLT